MSATDTTPAQLEVLSVETLALMADMSAQLGSGESISSASVELIQIDTGTNFTAGLSGSPTISGGNLLTQVVTGLQAGKHYLLVWIGTVAANKIVAAKTRLDCPL